MAALGPEPVLSLFVVECLSWNNNLAQLLISCHACAARFPWKLDIGMWKQRSPARADVVTSTGFISSLLCWNRPFFSKRGEKRLMDLLCLKWCQSPPLALDNECSYKVFTQCGISAQCEVLCLVMALTFFWRLPKARWQCNYQHVAIVSSLVEGMGKI